MCNTSLRRLQLWISFLLCAAMLLAMVGAVQADEKEEAVSAEDAAEETMVESEKEELFPAKTIHIETAEDFLTFA